MAATTAEIICWIAAVCTSLNSAAITLASVLLGVCLFPLMPDDVLSPDATMQRLLSEVCTKIVRLQCWCMRTRAEPIILFQISTYYSSIFDRLFSLYQNSNLKNPRIWHCTKQSVSSLVLRGWYVRDNSIIFLMLSSSRQVLQNSFDFLAPVTSRHSSGNSFTRCEAMMLLGSLDPSPLRRQVSVNTPFPREVRQSWGLQSIKCRSCGAWQSFVDTRRSFADQVSHAVHTVQVPCWFQFITQCNMHYIIYFATFYLL